MKKIIILILVSVLMLSIAACGRSGDNYAATLPEVTERPATMVRPDQTPQEEPEGDPIELLSNAEKLLFDGILEVLSDFDDPDNVRVERIESQRADELLIQPHIITLISDSQGERPYFFEIRGDANLEYIDDLPETNAVLIYRYRIDYLNEALEYRLEQ
jgi:predicted small lipoprotein YifL